MKWSIFMKKVTKIVVPILLALLILASLVWYCFVYDRDFTRDVLLSQARYHSTDGNSKLASWFYDLAYSHSGQDENVAIELANQFKAAGNYTKAEYTLSHAISDGGTLELYIALCKTYVEQDKLLDAVQMLNNVQDPTIKSQLETLRPAAPTSDPVPGFYSEYISVSLDSPQGTIYYTLDGEYPSIDTIPYSDPIQLPAGESLIYAISVGDNGLVSPVSVLGYTVAGVIEEVSFQDAALNASIREILGVDSDQVLYTNQLWSITSFTVPADTELFEELSKLPYLESLTFENQKVSSLQFLSSLTALKELSMTDCSIPADELNVIAALPALQKLTLSHCGLSTIAGLELAQNLSYLDLSNNTIRNLTPLAGLLNLQTLNLSNNALTNLADLSSLSDLSTLDVSYNSLSSIVPIATCIQLQWLNVSHNALYSLGAVDNLWSLESLYAGNNQLTEVEVLEKCTGLTTLDLSNNSITDITGLSALVKLESLNFSYNQVTELPAWPADCALGTINGSYNSVTSISKLKGLENLTHVYMDYNQITSVSDLASCYRLILVNVYGNDVTGVKDLTKHDIIVNYDPT